MNENAKRNLKNAMVLVLADGELAEGEKTFLETLRDRLGLDAADFRQAAAEVREDRKKISLPASPAEAEELLRILVEAASADGIVTPAERNLLERITDHIGISRSSLETMLSAGASQESEAEITALTDAIYDEFTGWDEPTRIERIGQLAGFPQGALAILRLLESYRVPDDAENSLELKAILVAQLGQIGDERAVYYLVQQVCIGDGEDEITNAALRQATAEAIGKIVKENFTADSAGIQAARRWWQSSASKPYDHLAI